MVMVKEKCSWEATMLIWVMVAGLVSQKLMIFPVMASTFEDQKNYYPPGSHGHHSHGHTPSHGSRGSYGGNPPSHTTPSHGSYNPTPSTPSHGSYNPTPSTPPDGNCGTPPSVPTTPSTPVPTTPSTPVPTTPSTPVPTTPSTPVPTTPSNPPSRGGGYYPSPPTTGGGGGSPPTPIIVTPPTTPSVPTPPYVPDPNSPFTCNYWRNHPGIIWGLFGWWGTVGNAFGVTNLPGFGASMNLQQALSNTHSDGYGTLYREGTASLLNSMVSQRFPFTTRQVRERFIAALASNKAAAAQGQLFKMANEGKLKPRT